MPKLEYILIGAGVAMLAGAVAYFIFGLHWSR